MMKKLAASGILGCFLVLAATLLADEPAHLEFVRELRARHYPDLALEYLQSLLKNPPAELAPLLPLEIAKVRLDLAAAEQDTSKRLSLYSQAEGEFESFLKNFPKHPLAAEARVELARVAVLRGKTELSRALQQETPEARQSGRLKARLVLTRAGALLAKVVPELKKQLETAPEPKTAQEKAERKALQQARLQAELDQALNLIDQAQTYREEGEDALLRAKIIEKALPLLQAVGAEDRKNSYYWIAQAWVGRCYQETGKPREARIKYNDVMSEVGEHTDAGKRLARYFRMTVLRESPATGENSTALIVEAGQLWLQLYRAHLNTREGYGVRFELADAYYRQAQAMKGASAEKGRLYDQAKTLFRQLEQSDSEFSDQARLKKIQIVFSTQGGEKTPVTALKTFEDCFVRAQYEAYQMGEEAKKLAGDAKKLDESRKSRFQTIVAALTRAVAMADGKTAKVTPQDLGSARSMLAYSYLATGKNKEAIAVGESLARAKPPLPDSAKGGLYAVQAYVQLLADRERDGAAEEDLKDERDQLRQLAEFIRQTWPDDPAGDVARHQIGLAFIREKKFPEAVDTLASIKPGYGAAAYAQYQLALAALEAHQAKAAPAGADKRPFQDQAIAALVGIPDLPASTDSGTAQVYMYAKLKLGQIFYAAKRFDDVEQLADKLQQVLPALRFDSDKIRDEIALGVVSLRLYAVYAKAELQYGDGKYGDVSAILDKQVIAPMKGGKMQELKQNPQLRWALLGLAMRAKIQEGKTADAQGILQLLQGGSAQAGGAAATLVPLIQMLRDQVQELRKKGDAAKPQLDKTVASFGTFLDELAKQEKSLSPEMLVLLAQSYSSLGQHKKTAALLEQVQEPMDDSDPKKTQVYRAARILHAGALRQDKQFDKVKTILGPILGTPTKPGWGANSYDAQHERILLLQDQEIYGGKEGAVVAWSALMKQLQPGISKDNRTREQYFDCYFNFSYCYFKNALKLTDEKQKQASIQKAAGYIVNLEKTQQDLGGEACKKRFEELLEREALLKEEYAKQGGKLFVPAQARPAAAAPDGK